MEPCTRLSYFVMSAVMRKLIEFYYIKNMKIINEFATLKSDARQEVGLLLERCANIVKYVCGCAINVLA